MRALPIPSSLKWLIDKRMRVSGEVEKSCEIEAARLIEANSAIEKAHASYLQLVEENEQAAARHQKYLDVMATTISATDLLLREHEIPIDPNELPTVRGHRNPAIADHNQLTSLIFESLREAQGQSRSTTEVALYVLEKLGLCHSDTFFPDFKYRVRKRLGHLVWESRLDRVHLPKTSVEGRWKLLRSNLPPTQS